MKNLTYSYYTKTNVEHIIEKPHAKWWLRILGVKSCHIAPREEWVRRVIKLKVSEKMFEMMTEGQDEHIDWMSFLLEGDSDIEYLQLEQGSYATSYIPTGTCPTTRVTDELSGKGWMNIVDYLTLEPQRTNYLIRSGEFVRVNKEMTVPEIEKELGHPVKIVK